MSILRKYRIHSGERMKDAKIVQFLLDELRNLRSLVYYDNALDVAIESKKRDIKEATETYEMLQRIKSNFLNGEVEGWHG